MNEAEQKLIEALREAGEDIRYGTVDIQLTYSKGQLKKVLVTNKVKVVLLE